MSCHHCEIQNAPVADRGIFMQKDTEYGNAVRFRVFFRLYALGLGVLRVMEFSVPQVAQRRAFRRGSPWLPKIITTSKLVV